MRYINFGLESSFCREWCLILRRGQSYVLILQNLIPDLSAQDQNHSSAPPDVAKFGTPCPALFVANLWSSFKEQLIQVFSRCSEYLKLKKQSTYGASVAFVDFQDNSYSTAALTSLQGTVLYSSPGGMRSDQGWVCLRRQNDEELILLFFNNRRILSESDHLFIK
ncbi:uncharacterized protein LOC123219303 isoform X2 [Mangifera indica]|uniref:uncharacterized protein LOC123219303 isoform X2 n=1 Tax=Mangifera indica TaxID=29780 RepID=UPI001CFA9884|nr:uncharacterized protein LOC123219303 isoform X2 [Mangifera indica]